MIKPAQLEELYNKAESDIVNCRSPFVIIELIDIYSEIVDKRGKVEDAALLDWVTQIIERKLK